jgi:sugar/nucleoside kinase (ribokinase family)
VDVLLANEAEAAVLGDARAARELVVKRGPAGATGSDGTRRVGVAAAPADVRDTTGAGDAFAAGFLTAWPGPPEPALARGAEIAALAVSRDGGRP